MSLFDTIDDFTDRQLHGVYSALGRNVGWYDDLASLAQGRYTLYKSEQQPPWDEIKIKNALGVAVNATQYLVSKGLVPSWLPAEQKQAIVSKAANTPTVSDLIRAAPGAAENPLPQYLAMGAVALGLILLLRR